MGKGLRVSSVGMGDNKNWAFSASDVSGVSGSRYASIDSSRSKGLGVVRGKGLDDEGHPSSKKYSSDNGLRDFEYTQALWDVLKVMFCPSSRKVPGRNELGVALLGGRSAELRFGVSELL
jgi:hypothetical protein